MTSLNKFMRATLLSCSALALVSAASAAGLAVATVEGQCTQEVSVALTASAVTGMDAFGFDLNFNTANLTYVRTEAGTATSDWGIIGGNIVSTGVLRVGGAKFSGTAVSGTAEIIKVVFTCSGGCDAAGSTVSPTNLVDDLAGATTTNGTVSCKSEGSPVGPVTKIKEYTFDANAEGWTFQVGGGPTFADPIGDVATPGYLLIASSGNNTNTFGFLISPTSGTAGFQMDSFDPSTDTNQTAVPAIQREGTYYLVRYYLRRTSADKSKANVFRLRANSLNFEDYHILTVNSVGNNERIPGIFTSGAVDLFFQPHILMYSLSAAQRAYTVAFDIINFGTGDDDNGGYILDKVQVYSVPVGKTGYDDASHKASGKTYTFAASTDFDDWENFNYAPTFEPVVFGSTAGTGLLIHAQNPASDPAPLATSGFGNWQSKSGAIVPNVGGSGLSGKLFLRAKYTVGANEASGHKVPQMRFRIMPSSFTSVAETGVLDNDTFTFVPHSGADRFFRTYLEMPASTTTFSTLAAWDLLSFESFANTTVQAAEETSTNNVILRRLDVDIIKVDDYPAVD